MGFGLVEDGGLLPCPDFRNTSDGNTTLSKCAIAKENTHSINEACRNDAGFINYLEFNYCTMDGLTPVSMVILVVWLLVLFYLLVSTTEQYFCPSLSKLSKRLRLSNNLAGVTFLAFSNGAPDLFSAISAFTHGADTIGVSFLLGAGVFVTMLVLGMIFIISPSVKLTRRPFLRDLIFYFIVLSAFCGIVMDKQVYLWESGLFVSIYLIYIIGVFAARYMSQKIKKKQREALGIIEDSGEELFEVSDVADDSLPMLDNILFPTNNRSWSASNKYLPRKGINSDDEPILRGYNDDDDEDDIRSQQSLRDTLKACWFRALSSIGWSELRTRDKVMLLFIWPIGVLRSLTVPCAGPEGMWSRPLAVLSPVTVPLLLLVSLKEYSTTLVISGTHVPLWALVLAIGAVFSVIAFFTTSSDEPPKFLMLFVVLGFVGATIWMYIFATEIIALVRAVGRIVGLSDSIMGLILVAWATSVVDVVSNYIVSKQGYTDMAVGACFGAPTYALLLGVGLSVTYKNLINFPEPLKLRVTGHMWVGFLFLGISVLSTLIFIPLNKFTTSKKYGIYLLLLYVVFSVLSVLLEIGIPIPFL